MSVAKSVPPSESPVKEVKRGYLLLLLRVFLIAAVCFLVFTQVLLVTQAKGNDMFPSIRDGDLLLVSRLHRGYAKNDVIVYSFGGETYTGRIAALEHDVVTIDDSGILSVNGTEQYGEILYPTYPAGSLAYPYTVPDGCVFVLGDYRTVAHDSRERGEIRPDQIQGKVIGLFRRRGL